MRFLFTSILLVFLFFELNAQEKNGWGDTSKFFNPENYIESKNYEEIFYTSEWKELSGFSRFMISSSGHFTIECLVFNTDNSYIRYNIIWQDTSSLKTGTYKLNTDSKLLYVYNLKSDENNTPIVFKIKLLEEKQSKRKKKIHHFKGVLILERYKGVTDKMDESEILSLPSERYGTYICTYPLNFK